MKPSIITVFLVRIGYLLAAYFSYLIQIILLLFGFRKTARRMMEFSARMAIKMFGIDVRIMNVPAPTSQPIIFIGNHNSAIDVFVVQGYLKERGLTTANDYMKSFLPFFAKSMRNYGHVPLSRVCMQARLNAYYQFSELLQQQHNVFTFPSGSIVTKITKRVSPSCYFQAIKNNAVIIPVFFNYGVPDEIERVRKQIPKTSNGRFKSHLLFYRLIEPKITLKCAYGDILYPSMFADKHHFCEHIKRIYSEFEMGNSLSN